MRVILPRQEGIRKFNCLILRKKVEIDTYLNYFIYYEDLSSFVQFSQLTESQVCSWLEQKLQSEMIEDKTRLELMHEILSNKIQEKLQPKVVSSQPPWLS